MSNNSHYPAVKRYPLLHLISGLYKLAAWLVFIAAIFTFIISVPSTRYISSGMIFSLGLLYLLSGGFGGLSLYVMARLIDLFLETNDHTRQMAETLHEQNRLLKQMYRRQANPYPRPSDAIAERQARLLPKQPEI